MKQGEKNSLNEYGVLILGILMLFFLYSMDYHGQIRYNGHNGKTFIQISGDVMYPGLYPFDRETGLIELIRRSGGLLGNSAAPPSFRDVTLSSGKHVIIMRNDGRWTFWEDNISAFYKITIGMPVSLNAESEDGLTAIPGIGPVLANTIVRERNKRGGFKNPEELKSLYGIGPKLFKRIIPFINL